MHEHVLEGGIYAFYTVGKNYGNILAYDDLSKDEDINGKSEELKRLRTLLIEQDADVIHFMYRDSYYN